MHKVPLSNMFCRLISGCLGHRFETRLSCHVCSGWLCQLFFAWGQRKTLSSSPYLSDIHAVGQGQDVSYAVIATLLFINFWYLCWGVRLRCNPNQTLKCFTFRSAFICLNELEWFKITVSYIKTTVNLKLRAKILSFRGSAEKPKCPALDLDIFPWNEWEEFPYRSCARLLALTAALKWRLSRGLTFHLVISKTFVLSMENLVGQKP